MGTLEDLYPYRVGVHYPPEPPVGSWVRDRFEVLWERGADGWRIPGMVAAQSWVKLVHDRAPIRQVDVNGYPLAAAEMEVSFRTAPSFRVVWTYVDQFQKDRRESSGHMGSLPEAQYFASLKFTEVKPDAWWIEAVTTVEYHGEDVPF